MSILRLCLCLCLCRLPPNVSRLNVSPLTLVSQAGAKAIVDFITQHGYGGKSGIIYCTSRKKCEDLARQLTPMLACTGPTR